MNRNYKIRTLMNPDNWIKSGDKLVFVQLFGGRHDHDYPCSIYDAMRVVSRNLEQAGLLAEHGTRCEGWAIAIPSAAWASALKIMEETFYHHDFGDRLAIYRLDELGWDYNPAEPETFTKDADYVKDAEWIADDLSDWTSVDVKFIDTSVDKGYWKVSLATDEDRARFADLCGKYEKAQKRISETMANNVLLFCQEQYEKAKEAIDSVRYTRVMQKGDTVMVAFPEETYTKQIVTILDAAGI